MILRKPYAFLIRHFKLIHLALLAPLLYITIKTSGIVSFFQTMAVSNYVTNEVNIASSHINIFVFLSLFVVIASSIMIYMLMKQKDKKTFFYLALIIYYLILSVGMFLAYRQMFFLEKHDAVASTVRLFRDFSKILYYPQYIFVVFALIRGVGFDIKSFNFSKDLEELELEDEDNEEVEIAFGKDNYKYKRDARKTLRELKYYVLENKLVFSALGVLLIVFGFYTIFMNREVYNKKYSIGQPFTSNGLIINVKDSILTPLKYDGSLIADGKNFLAVKIGLVNRSNQEIELNKDNFRVFIDGSFIYPTLEKTTDFLDFGSPYFGYPIKANSSSEYVFVYEIPEGKEAKTYDFRVLDSIVYGVGELHPKYRMITLRPSVEPVVEEMGAVTDEKEVPFTDTSLPNFKIKLKDYEFNNKFSYTYERCSGKECRDYKGSIQTSASTYLIVDPELTIDEESYYYKNRIWHKDFFEDFAIIIYQADGIERRAKLVDKTPAYYQGTKKVYQVPKAVELSKRVELMFTIRDRSAIIVLKNKA